MDGLLREFGAVRAEAPNVVLIDIGTNDLCNGCVAEELAEGIVAFARKLTTISSVLNVVICHILTRIPKSSGCFLVPDNFEPARHAISDTVIRLTSDLIIYISGHTVNCLTRKTLPEMVYTWVPFERRRM